jgi:hypothetical protein
MKWMGFPANGIAKHREEGWNQGLFSTGICTYGERGAAVAGRQRVERSKSTYIAMNVGCSSSDYNHSKKYTASSLLNLT